MESKLKAAAMDSVGELPAGYLHLPTTPIKQEPELTDWISGDLKPVRDGVYQRKTCDNSVAYWYFKDGLWLYGGWDKPELCRRNFSHTEAPHQDTEWRGLTKEVQP